MRVDWQLHHQIDVIDTDDFASGPLGLRTKTTIALWSKQRRELYKAITASYTEQLLG